MKASPEEIWPLVSDVANTRRFAAETFDAQWLDGATGAAVGVRFRGHVKRNGWGQFEPSGDGTDVTESFELHNDWYLRLYWTLLGWARRRTNVDNMRTTLERIRAAAEPG
jgi:hypothetical protein